MLRRALDFWMEPPGSYSPIIKVGASSSDIFEDQKEPRTKSADDNSINSGRKSRCSDICWLHVPEHPLSFQWFLTIRGSENFHLYLWLIKDLAWAQSWYYTGHIFGSLAVIWSVYILSHAAQERNTNEVFTGVAQTFWLMANVWWMTGDLHDRQFPDGPRWYEARTIESGHMMQAALCWLGIYYLIVKPLKLLGCDNPEALKHYNNTGLNPKLSMIFSTWREYENCHILFWLGKDCAWNGLIPSMWIIFVLPTLFIALDFVFTSLFSKTLIVDHSHYFSQFIWVLANAVWAGGEIFDPEHDEPFPLIDMSSEARITLRWYSSWMLIVACGPVLTMYAMWVYYTMTGNTNLGVADTGHGGGDRHVDNTHSTRIDEDCLHEGSEYNLQPVHRSDPASTATLKRSGGGSGDEEDGKGGGSGGENGRNQFLGLHSPYHIVSTSKTPSFSNNNSSSSDYHSNSDELRFVENPLSSSLLPPSAPEQNGKSRNATYVAPTLGSSSSPLVGAEEDPELNMNEFEVMDL